MFKFADLKIFKNKNKKKTQVIHVIWEKMGIGGDL
jgi:hypothetical protein